MKRPDRNGLLLAAGYAPGYGESDLSAPELAEVGSADERLFQALVQAAGERAMDRLIAMGNHA